VEAEEHVSPLSWIGVGTGARTVTTVVGQCRPAIQKKRTAPATAKHSIAAEFAGPPQTFGASKGHLDGRDDCAQSADGHMPSIVRRSSNAPTMGLKFELAWDLELRGLCAHHQSAPGAPPCDGWMYAYGFAQLRARVVFRIGGMVRLY
jgi:hypothetical protein